MSRCLNCIGASAILFVVLPASLSLGQAKTEEERLQEYVRIALEDFKKKNAVDLARQALEQHRANATDAYEKLSTLAERAKEHFRRIDLLLENDEGKRLATSPSHIAQYMDIQSHPPLRIEDIEANRRIVNRVLESVRMDPDLVQADYVPNGQDVKEIRRIYAWADIALDGLVKQVASIDDMLKKAPGSVDLTKARSLRVAVDERKSLLDVLSSNAAVTADELTKIPAMQILVDGATQARLEQATHKAALDLAELRAELDRQKVQYEERIANLEKETAADRTRIQIERDKAQEELVDLKRQADAQLHAGKVKSEIEAKGTYDDAEHARKVAKAQSPEVKNLCKYFITSGYHQFHAKDSLDQQPVSLNLLRSNGALDPSVQGLNKLLDIGCDKADKERPRFGYPSAWGKLNPAQKEELKQIQGYLIELGEVMVELGMLAP